MGQGGGSVTWGEELSALGVDLASLGSEHERWGPGTVGSRGAVLHVLRAGNSRLTTEP